MTTFKSKLKISRLERETYVSCTENHIFVLKFRRTPKMLRVGKKNRIGRFVQKTIFLIVARGSFFVY